MERPRFQFDIVTLMIAVAAVAVLTTLAIYLGALAALNCVPITFLLIGFRYIYLRSRAEGRVSSEADNRIISDFQLAGTIVALVLFSIYLLAS
jgi:hypothetical protein